MRILQLIVSGTLANAGRPERVKTKQQNNKDQMIRPLVTTAAIPDLDYIWHVHLLDECMSSREDASTSWSSSSDLRKHCLRF
jgi:hypothetical protein